MIYRLKEKARGTNAIGPWIALSCWALTSNAARRDRMATVTGSIASPREIADAQANLVDEARRRLGPNCDLFLQAFSMGLMDDLQVADSRVIQINARYQGFEYQGALQPLSVQQFALIGGGKTRAIDLE